MKKLQILSLVLALVALVATGCSKTSLENQSAAGKTPPTANPSASSGTTTGSDADSGRLAGKALDESRTAQDDIDIREAIYFAFDSDRLDAANQVSLSQKATWLQNNPQVQTILIEGHCDERGTDAYNMALGARRADTVKDYLIDLGVANGKLATQSFGEEKPADRDRSEAAWAKNRRANFVID